MKVIYQCSRCPLSIIYDHTPGTNFGGAYHHGQPMNPISLEGC